MKIVLYKLLALLSLGAAIALGILVLHFSLAETKITVTANHVPVHLEPEIFIPIKERSVVEPKDADVENEEKKKRLRELRNQVLKNNEDNDSLENFSPLVAELRTIPISIEHKITPQGEGERIEEQAEGIVVLYNELSFDQELVKSTRLLTDDDVLFRTQEYVIIPSGGSIEVLAKADISSTGEKGNIPANTHLTIPGLPSRRQQSIFGRSKEAFKGGVKIVHTISQDDFDRAEKEASSLLEEYALAEFNKQGLATTTRELIMDEIVFETEDEVGQQKPELTIVASSQAKRLIFDEVSLIRKTMDLLKESLPDDRIILAYNEESFRYTLRGFHNDGMQAIVQTYLEGFTTLKDGNWLIDKRTLVGLTAPEIQALLLKNEAVQEVRVEFSPFWVTRAPRIPDKISIEVKEEL